MQINRYTCQNNVHIKSSNPKPKCIFPNNLLNVHPTFPQNKSQDVSFSGPESYASYAKWLNESQVQENRTIQNFLIVIITKLFLLLYIYISMDMLEQAEAVVQRCSVGLRPEVCYFIKKERLWHRCFPVNFAKFLRTTFFIEHLWWLLLNRIMRSIDIAFNL